MALADFIGKKSTAFNFRSQTNKAALNIGRRANCEDVVALSRNELSYFKLHISFISRLTAA